jgi:hypothetical protein
MFQHDFQFFVNLMNFFLKKKKWSNIPISHLYKFSNQKKKKKKLVVTCVFECFQSQCHILKELHDFLHMMGAITIFEKNNFIFNIVNYGLVTKSLGAGCTFEEVT